MKEEGGTPKVDKTEKKKEGSAKKEVKAEAEPDAEDMISTVKSRRLMVLQAKKDKEEHDRLNKGEPGAPSLVRGMECFIYVLFLLVFRVGACLIVNSQCIVLSCKNLIGRTHGEGGGGGAQP